MYINDYSVYQSIQTETISILGESMKAGKLCKTGMAEIKRSEGSEEFFSSNDLVLGQVARNKPLRWIDEKTIQFFRDRDSKWMAKEQSITEDLPSIARNYVSRLGDVDSICINATCTERFDVLSQTPDDEIVNQQKWVMAEIRLAIREGGGVWEINRQTGSFDKKLSTELLMKYLKELVDTYQPYIGLPLISVNTECDLILPRGQGGILIHEAIGHALEADCFCEETSILHNCFNKSIAPEYITVYDAPLQFNGVKRAYSDDGTPSRDCITLIQNGLVSGVLSDSKTASRWGIMNTGNGRSESFSYLPIPRMRNTYMSNGTESFGNILQKTHRGILALDIGGGQVNLQSGDFLFNITNGVYIENGIPKGRTMPFVFRGHILRTLNQIDLVGNDLSFHHAVCGKKGQYVPVSYGQPTIRICSQHIGE